MKALLSLLFSAFIFTSCYSKGYSPAFEADHVFNLESEKYSYLSKKYNPSLDILSDPNNVFICY